MRLLLQRRWDPDLYRSLSDRFDRMHMYVSALPTLAGPWSELLMSRVDLTHALWTVSTPSRINGKVVAFHAQHSVHVEDLLRRCKEYTPLSQLRA
jgi:hypothetical protein